MDIQYGKFRLHVSKEFLATTNGAVQHDGADEEQEGCDQHQNWASQCLAQDVYINRGTETHLLDVLPGLFHEIHFLDRRHERQVRIGLIVFQQRAYGRHEQ